MENFMVDIHLGGISRIELWRRLAASHAVIFKTEVDNESTRQEAKASSSPAP